MKKIYKAIALVLCAALLVAGSIFGTLAYLTSKTATVTNTFTAGKVEITLHEYEIDATGKKTTTVAPAAGLEGIKLVPGRVIQKNPVITVKANSEACYLFVEVKNGLSDLVAINWAAGEWIQIGTTNIYYYKTTVTATADTPIEVFPTVTCKDVNGAYSALNATNTIEITAYAVQAEGFGTAQEAWTATFGAPANP